MAWDPTHKVILLFGGSGGSGVTNDLDGWDGSGWRSLTSDGPPRRDDALLVADPQRGVVVLTGGRAGQRVFTDTWEWDGTAWTERDVEGPPARVHAAAAWDATSKRVIVYGGVGTDEVTRRDTWAWDGATWEQLGTRASRIASQPTWPGTRCSPRS
ncbi:MAG TPA: hypothetical protein VM451_07925 [Candidatus Limnocylindria bacterium]|nr:hypothetical protein [Candidatus Limnocylindria bacterium]